MPSSAHSSVRKVRMQFRIMTGFLRPFLPRLERRIAAGGLFALGLSAVAFAQPAPDCGGAYKAMLVTIERKQPSLSAEALLARQRVALRLYDACRTGHLEHPGELFDKLDRNRY
ncbi:MAG TPA: hypothetical protein VFR19_03070 [Hyphomicrobiaceae bacterium]|nr:hypothetical protein [Hyphomicrobiaceae bacterium]